MYAFKRYPSVIMATACIPWNEQYCFDENCFRKQIRSLISMDIRHIYIFGSAGEGYAVNDEQFDYITKVFSEEMRGDDVYPMVGLISLSISAMIRRIESAYAFGIRDFQFALPCWGILTEAEMYDFFHTLCGSFPDCRFMFFNTTKAKKELTVKDYIKLAEEIPNLVACKHVTWDIFTLHELISTPCPIQFFNCEIGFAYGSMIGECGLILTAGNMNIPLSKDFFSHAINKDLQYVMAFQENFYTIVKELFEIVGNAMIDGAYDKIYSKIIDPLFPLRLLPPYTSCSDEKFERFCRFLSEKYTGFVYNYK